MKLKKIASLMLAGIMAVSMLAGCKDGASSSTSDDDTVVTPVATGIADGANSTIGSYGKNILGLSYVENPDLVNALKAAAEAEYKTAEIKAVLNGNSRVSSNDVTNAGAGANVAAKVARSMVGMNADLDWTTGDFNMSAEGTVKKLWIFTVGGAYGADDAGALISQNNMINVVKDTEMKLSDGSFKADYDADIAAVKVTSKEETDKSIWVVAIMITQTVTKA